MAVPTRRSFLKSFSLAAAGAALSPHAWAQVAGANADIRLGIAGLNGRGKDLIREFGALPGVRIVALCDADSAVLAAAAQARRDAGGEVRTFADLRGLLAQKDIDAVALATPNHLHALQAVWACQAGKDVYLEKPVSHNLWEGRKIVEAAAKYRRVVQAGSQCRSSDSLAEAVAWVRAGNLGKITSARGLCYKRRASLGLTANPPPVPASVNYDLWCGPAPLAPPHRAKFHYDWHWFWATGNGDLGNQGVHQLDIARWFLGEAAPAPRVLTVGGRLGYADDGETPNTLLVWHDYAAAPLLFEVRGLPARAGANAMDSFQGASIGVIVQCEGGSVVVPSYTTANALDRDGKLLKKFTGASSHAGNFIDVVRSRKLSDLRAPIQEGHASAALAHLANISHRLGRAAAPEAVREQFRASQELSGSFARLTEHLAANAVDLAQTPLTLGLPLAFDPGAEHCTGENAAAANALLTREYRKPYVVPESV